MYRVIFIHSERTTPDYQSMLEQGCVTEHRAARIGTVHLVANLERLREQEYALLCDADGVWAATKIVDVHKVDGDLTLGPRVHPVLSENPDSIPQAVARLVGTEKPWGRITEDTKAAKARFRYGTVNTLSQIELA